MKRFYQEITVLLLIILLQSFSGIKSYSQLPEVDESKLVYTSVINFWCQFSNDTDTLLVSDASGFSIGDTVLFHHTISGWPYDIGFNKGDIIIDRNAGTYGIYLIDTIEGNKIALNNTFPEFGRFAHEPGEYGQLIKMLNYERAKISTPVNIKPWDPVSKTGGIFPIMVHKKLVLETDLSADGKGFLGGQTGSDDYVASGGVCSEGVFGVNDEYFTASAVDSGALKGSSFHNETVNYVGFTRGRGHIGSGGGGGNAKYSGGGGGSNRGQGGAGGKETNDCTVPGMMGGEGGQSFNYETDPSLEDGNRIRMGGGGGAGTQSPSNGRIGSSGGNGGGIIILITDTLEAVGSRAISANGASVPGPVTAGAGGGGGGGVLIMEVSNYIGNVSLQVKGGMGGSVTPSPDITGPGGGGGGGVIQHNEISLPGTVSPVLQEPSGFNSGVVGSGPDTNGAGSGANGLRQGNLLIPIRGFIVNTLPDDQTICEGLAPKTLNASKAKGGSGDFTYKWLQSSDAENWVVASGVNNQVTYSPPVLTDTTYYRRYVVDNINTDITDSGFYTTINVHPKIENNLIIADDTICFNLAPENDLSSALSLSGGVGGLYSYKWIDSDNDSDFDDAPGTIDQFDYTVPNLSTTRYYKRIVESGVCTDSSNSVKITVLPSLNSLDISEDQIICNNDNAATLEGDEPGGGQTGDKRYEWYQTAGGIRTMVATTEDYDPGVLTTDTYTFRRWVYSGSDDACIDSSNSVSILVYPNITGNTISSPADTICANLPSITLDGSVPSNGKSGDYSYYWEQSPNGTGSWTSGGGSTDQEDFQPGVLNSTTWFRRTVYSASTDSACMDISAAKKIEILPQLVNTLTSPDDTICQETESPQITGIIASGGLSGEYTYIWESRKDNETEFSPAPGLNDGVNYSPGILNDTSYYYFRRHVLSGPANTCEDFSDPVSIFIQPTIKNNDFETPAGLDVCYGTTVLVDAKPVTGGNENHLFGWEQSVDGGLWEAADGINDSEDYTKDAFILPTEYRRIVVSGKCTDTTSVPILVDTLSLPVLANLTSSLDTICNDQTNFFLGFEIFSAEGSPVDYTINYNDNVNADTEVILSANTGSVNITGFNPFTAYNYSVVSLVDGNGCVALEGLDQSIPLWVNKAPEPGINKPADPFMVCGTDFQLESIPDTNPGVSNGWWSVNQDFMDIQDSLASSGNFSHQNPDFDSTVVKVLFSQVTNSCGQRSDTLEVKLYEQPEDPEISEGDSLIIFLTDKTALNGEVPTAGFVNWTISSGNADIDGNEFSSTVENIPIEEVIVARYTVVNGNCESRFDEIAIIRKEVHVYEGISPENEDGKNDKLVAEGLQVEGISFTFQVFSTNGMLVRELTESDLDDLGFEKDLANNGRVLWDGRTKNENNFVPPGTYYYVLVIDYKGVEYVDKGFVVVK